MPDKTIQEMRKIELHCHMDGSISAGALQTLVEGPLAPVTVPEGCTSLVEYLGCFGPILAALQTPAGLQLAARDVLRQAAQDNIAYIEMRFAPLSHTAGGMQPQDVVEAAIKGMRLGSAEYGVRAGLILCMMRGTPDAENQQVLELAKAYKNKGVVGIDIAGDEASYPTARYKEILQKAARMGLAMTIHSGESGPAENVQRAIEFGARRIGHGIAIYNNEELMRLCRREDILLEICPTSNIHTCVLPGGWAGYPLQTLLQNGVPVCINTDNRTVSGTSLEQEYAAVQRYCGVTAEQLRQMNSDAERHVLGEV